MRFSSDGFWYWDGASWVSALSPDHRFRWNGRKWVTIQTPFIPSEDMVVVEAPAAAVSGRRVPTTWTTPLQRGVASYFGLTAVLSFVLAFLLSSQASQFFNQGVSQQSPLGEVDFAHRLTLFFSLVFVGGALLGTTTCVVGIVAALKRWVWAFYVIMVFTALDAIYLPFSLIGLVSSAAQSPAGIGTPGLITYLVQILYGAVSTAVLVWMWLALKSYGPWAMERAVP